MLDGLVAGGDNRDVAHVVVGRHVEGLDLPDVGAVLADHGQHACQRARLAGGADPEDLVPLDHDGQYRRAGRLKARAARTAR